MQTLVWRSFVLAYHADKAASIVNDGRSRTEYSRALPDLEAFYTGIGRFSNQSLNGTLVARNEREGGIQRERDQHPPAEWTLLQANIATDL